MPMRENLPLTRPCSRARNGAGTAPGFVGARGLVASGRRRDETVGTFGIREDIS